MNSAPAQFLQSKFSVSDVEVMESLSHHVRNSLFVERSRAPTSETSDTVANAPRAPNGEPPSGAEIYEGALKRASWAVGLVLSTPGGPAYEEAKRRIMASEGKTNAQRIQECARLNLLNVLGMSDSLSSNDAGD